MSDYAIEIRNLGKKYRLGQSEPYLALRDILSNPFASRSKTEEFWALKNVDIKVKEGEVLGLIGSNGSGKSTLLKILSQITPPTTGKVKLKGRVASLLEVGTGFSPELTGRENIFLNGSILGMSRTEIKRRFDEIVDFSGVEKFLDTPVKRYSSGMYVRLAFAVAAHLESEILLVDEVLAVGDAAFQKKCLGKIDDVAKSGRTVILVSHNMSAIKNLCSKVVLLKNGELSFSGNVTVGINKYLDKSKSVRNKGDFKFIKEFKIFNKHNQETNSVLYGDDIYFKIRIHPGKLSLENICLTIVLYDASDTPIATLTNILDTKTSKQTGLLNSKGNFICSISNINLKPGEYSVNVALNATQDIKPIYERLPNISDLTVISDNPNLNSRVLSSLHGSIMLQNKWELNNADNPINS